MTVEKDDLATPPWCKGSMRTPKRETIVGRARWGLCRTCDRFIPLSTRGAVKMHRDPAIPPGNPDSHEWLGMGR